MHAGAGGQLDDEFTTVHGAFVVVVATSAGRYRRRVFLSLAASEHAAERARQAGHDAHILLCRLDPVAAVAEQVDA